MFDYLVIESTGISEPMQVAETFTFTMDENSNEILSKIAKLDTCVTVVDASNFFRHFNTGETVTDRYKDADKRDERTITELMVDQLEFADIVLINKIDLVKDPKEIRRIKEVVAKLNPNAEVIETTRSQVPMNKIINTNKFDFDKAAQMDAWMERDRYDIQPETDEYNISSFIYTAYRPFDTMKVHKEVIDKLFIAYIFPEDKNAVPEEDHEHKPVEGDNKEEDNKDAMEEENADAEEAKEEDYMDEEQPEGDDVPNEDGFTRAEREDVANKFNDSAFRNVYRSKGMIYLASQCNSMWTWQTAGIVNEIKHLGKWLASGTKEVLIEKGHQDEYDSWEDKKQGDRKTQLVIIGSQLDKEGITKMLDDCLVSEEEYEKMRAGENIVNKEVGEDEEDPFRPVEDGEMDEEWVDEED